MPIVYSTLLGVNYMPIIKIKLLGYLREAIGSDYIDIEANDWVEALIKAREMHSRISDAIKPTGEPSPGYMVFVDGVDYRIASRGYAREVAILPIVHGGQDNVRFLTWNDITSTCNIVAERIINSGFKVDVIVGILRGGIIPATIIADILGIEDIGVIDIKFYQAPNIRREKPILKQPLTLPIYNKNTLIVDDVSDTGRTLQLALDYIRHYSPKEIKTVTLYVKPWTNLIPDYYAEITDKWLVFPWGTWEYKRQITQTK